MTCGKPSHIRKWFGPCVLSYGHGGSCEHPPLEALHESDGRCSKCGNDREAWDRAIAEIARLTAELAAARAVPAEVEVAIGLVDAIVEHARTLDSYDWQSRLDDRRTSDDAKDDARELSHALRDYDRSNGSTFLRTTIARAISDATAAAVGEFIDGHAKRLCEQAGESWEVERTKPGCWPAAVREVLDMLVATPGGLIIDGRSRQAERAAARGTVGGLLATAPVGSIVEAKNAIQWVQFRIAGGTEESMWRGWWWANGGEWLEWQPVDNDLDVDGIRQPARLVDAATCDASPESRGPLPKGG